MVRMVWVAEVSLACFLSLSIWGTASAIRISMMDMTIISSMRVKPSSGSRFEVRGSRCRSVFFMTNNYLSRMTAIEYRRFAGADDTAKIATLHFWAEANFRVDLRG
jgi:hypothetical protein